MDFLRNQIQKKYIAVGAHVKVIDERYGADGHDKQFQVSMLLSRI